MTENNKYTIVENNPDGSIKAFKNEPKRGYLGGCYFATEGEVSEKEIAMMKEAVIDKVCEDIRKIAREKEDFFIIKKGERFPGLDNTIMTTVAAKYMLPTVEMDIIKANDD
jgi:hypothetical protein